MKDFFWAFGIWAVMIGALVVLGLALEGCDRPGMDGFCDYCHARRFEVNRAMCSKCKGSHTYCWVEGSILERWSTNEGKFSKTWETLPTCPTPIDPVQKAEPPALKPVRTEDLPKERPWQENPKSHALLGCTIGVAVITYLMGRRDGRLSAERKSK